MGDLYCWGGGDQGQLGDGATSTADQATLVPVTYDGSPRPVSVTTDPPGLDVAVTGATR